LVPGGDWPYGFGHGAATASSWVGESGREAAQLRSYKPSVAFFPVPYYHSLIFRRPDCDASSIMAPKYAPLTISRALDASLRDIQTATVQNEDARQTLGALLQSALQLEFATIPTYLSAAFSLNGNSEIYELILRAAIEEMLHFTAVANLMNAIGVAPNIVAAVPTFPCDLTVLEPPLKLDLYSFSLDRVENLFMVIEAPEKHVPFPSAGVAAAAAKPRTIGQFYAGIIDIIKHDKIPDLFKNAVQDAYKQREAKPNFHEIAYINDQDSSKYPLKPEINFKITDKDSAAQHLSWVVGEGEGEAPYKPLDKEGLPGHHYRFESILKKRYLIKDDSVTLGYSFSGGSLPFDDTGVHEFDANAKAADYAAFPTVAEQMKSFNEKYTKMIDLLQSAFNCASPAQRDQAEAAYQDALRIMRSIGNTASLIVQEAEDNHIKAGIPFEYAGPGIS
jgi:rubrerythrin